MGSSSDRASGEDAWVDELRSLHAIDQAGWVGIGDDCAVLRHQGDLLFAADALVDGVHFLLESCKPSEAAFKSVAVNVSDIAACGGEPIGMVVSVVAPENAPRELLSSLNRGFKAASEQFRCPLLGGDTNVADGPLVLSVSMLGRLIGRKALLRSGAVVGDTLSVTGALGASIWGRHLHPRPRLDVARAIANELGVHAVMDISDGLRRDLPRMCDASKVGALINLSKIPVHSDVAMYGEDEATGVEHALDDGEDFELLIAHGALAEKTLTALDAIESSLMPIGVVTSIHKGIKIRGADGRVVDLGEGGFDHLARDPEK